MVADVKNSTPLLQSISRPITVELAGPAGAGKSTLARKLSQLSDRITICPEISFRNLEQFPTLVRSIPLVISLFTTRITSSRRWTWDESKFLVYLKTWNRILQQQADRSPRIILLDHGPIFKMATLHAFGPEWLRTASASAWWGDFFSQWAAWLDLIVWLDAPDNQLGTRINLRNHKHQVKGKTGSEVKQFLAIYRSSFQFVLSGLATFNGPKVIEFDSSQASPEVIAEGVMAACAIEKEICK